LSRRSAGQSIILPENIFPLPGLRCFIPLENIMHIETQYLEKIADEIAANAGQTKNSPNADHHLVNEAMRLEKQIRESLLAFDDFVQRDSFHFDTLSKLVEICDTLFNIDGQVNANVKVILGLLTAVKKIIPAEIRPNLRLPKAFVVLQKPLMQQSWAEQLAILQQQEIEPKFIAIAAIPFKEFFQPKHRLYWGDYTWLKAYERKLESMDWEHNDCNSKTEALISLLIAAGMNDDRFVVQCKNIIRDRAAIKIGRKEKLKELAFCRKLVLQDARSKSIPFKCRLDPLVTQLLVWITAEEEYTNMHEPEHPFAKLRFAWFSQKISFFFKLLHEQQVFEDTNFQELTQQIASTCLSVGGEDILATTLVSKAYPKKQKMLEEMEALLLAMLEYVRRFLPKK
jgi:hypothetical protein